MDDLILKIAEYEVVEGEGESLIAEFFLPELTAEGDMVTLGRASDVFQIGVQFDDLVRRGISRRHCLVFRQDGEILLKPLDGTVQDSARRTLQDFAILRPGDTYILFASKFFRSTLVVSSFSDYSKPLDCPKPLRDFSRDTASFGELRSIDEILSQLIEHRQAFKVAMEGLDLREQEILRRLTVVEYNDLRQSSTLKKTIVVGAVIVLGALGLKSFNNESLSALSNIVMAGAAVGGFVISQKSQK